MWDVETCSKVFLWKINMVKQVPFPRMMCIGIRAIFIIVGVALLWEKSKIKYVLLIFLFNFIIFNVYAIRTVKIVISYISAIYSNLEQKTITSMFEPDACRNEFYRVLLDSYKKNRQA